jgi:glycosyltransferase involved in cell wall biosynthesis
MLETKVAERTSSRETVPTHQYCWHIITCEYPPQIGGVSDYTHAVAAGLAAKDDEVHVWCPGNGREEAERKGLQVHAELGDFGPTALRRVAAKLDGFPGPRRFLVQWVPHGYGYRSMNLPFCWWLRKRVLSHGDRVEIMLHEPFLSFRWNSWRQTGAAFLHRLMTVILLSITNRVWMSIPAWEQCWRPYAFGKKISFDWLPIPTGIPVVADPEAAEQIRQRYAPPPRVLIGHVGTYGWPIIGVLEPILAALADDSNSQSILLMGKGSAEYRSALIGRIPALGGLVQATGALSAEDLSRHIAACDLLIQPFPDGASSRRTSLMAGLSHGKPVVTTSGALTEDLWSETGVVPIAPARDVPGFIELVRGLRDNPKERARIGQAAQALYEERLHLKHTISSLRSAAAEGQQLESRPKRTDPECAS